VHGALAAHDAGMTWTPDSTESVVLRPATDFDAPIVRRLAALDDAPRLTGPVLLALVDGEAVAALSLEDGRVVADPFRLTGDAVALLRLRAQHLTPAVAPRRHHRPALLRPRAA
jgi:hypothetical protein